MHCALEKSCCGCVKVWNQTDSWNLETNCEERENSNVGIIQQMSKKPGRIHPYCTNSVNFITINTQHKSLSKCNIFTISIPSVFRY